MATRNTRWTLAIVGIVVLVLVGVGFAFDWSWVEGIIEQQVSDRLGREVRVEVIHGGLGWEPSIHVEGLTVTNPDWAPNELMIEAAAVDFEINLPRLLFGTIEVPELRAQQPVIHLAKSADGRPNWAFGTQQKQQQEQADGGVSFTVREIALDQPTVSYRDLGTGFVTRGQAARITGSVPAPAGTLTFHEADLRYNEADQARALSLAFPQMTYSWTAGGDMSFDGSMRYARLEGKSRTSDLSGTFRYAGAQGVTTLTGDLRSDYLDLALLLTATTDWEQGGEAGGEPPAQQQQQAQPAGDGGLIPRAQVPETLFEGFDIDVHYEGSRVMFADLSFDDVKLDFSVSEGEVKVEPLEVQLVGGTFDLEAIMEQKESSYQDTAELRIRQVDLADVMRKIGANPKAWGDVRATADLQGRGQGLDAFLAQSSGNVWMFMREGRVDHMLAELAALDLAEALAATVGDEKKAKIRCGAVGFDVHDGIAKIDRGVLATGDTNFVLHGQFNLDEETMDIAIEPRDKDFTVLSAQAPIHLQGPLGSPNVNLGWSDALESILTPFEMGEHDMRDCAKLTTWVRTH
jgi:uncharacterized protein involved in outer membrane biogenesis